MNDLISRQAAIDALGEEPEVWTGKDEYAQGLNNQWHYDVNALKTVPSTQTDGIPLEWIDKHIEWLDNCDNDFAQLAKVSIKAMVDIWKKDRI